MTPPVKPWRIVSAEPGMAYLATPDGAEIGFVVRIGHAWRACLGGYPGEVEVIDDRRTRAEAAAIVYQAWLDRTSEGMKK